MAKKKDKQGIGRIVSNNLLMLKYIAKFTPGLLVWTILSAVLSGGITVLNTAYIAKHVLDGLQEHRTFLDMLPFLLFVMALNLLLALIKGLYNGAYFPQKKEYLYGKMHEELFQRAGNMELACYDNPKFYNDFVWAMSQVDEKALTMLERVSELLACVTTVIGSTAIILGINPVGLLFVVVSLMISYFLRKKVLAVEYELSLMQKPLQRKRDYTSRILYQADYAKEIRLTPVKEILVDNFGTANQKLVKAVHRYGIKRALYHFLASGSDSLLLYGCYVAYLLYGTLVRHLYTYGSMFAVFSSTISVGENWSRVVYFLTQLQQDSLYIERFRSFLEYEPKMMDKEYADPAPQKSEAICLEHVGFTYEGASEPTLKDISLTIHPGEKVALVGYNGAGKTTLIKLIMRLYEVSAGSIRLGGTDIRDYRLKEYRNYFGVVFQDYQLLASTIAENVKMDRVTKEDGPKIVDALTRSGFKEKLDSLPHGTDTFLSREFDKNGVQLSGGEGQKVAIARVFPRDCHVVILDEPSSALDPISEYNVNQSMLEAAKDKTVLFISHRLSTTKIADRIIMLEAGRIIEEGSHEELMELDGNYARMFRLQAEKYQSDSGETCESA